LSHYIGPTFNEKQYRSEGFVVIRWSGRSIVCISGLNMFTFP